MNRVKINIKVGSTKLRSVVTESYADLPERSRFGEGREDAELHKAFFLRIVFYVFIASSFMLPTSVPAFQARDVAPGFSSTGQFRSTSRFHLLPNICTFAAF